MCLINMFIAYQVELCFNLRGVILMMFIAQSTQTVLFINIVLLITSVRIIKKLKQNY